ncbi:MAG: hypothetical protein IV100_12845 [Myxococcales bacterium]|nr:hypothetical protein [Myxococcales bacterium]
MLTRGVMAPRPGADPRAAQNFATAQAQILQQQQKQAASRAAQEAQHRATMRMTNALAGLINRGEPGSSGADSSY